MVEFLKVLAWLFLLLGVVSGIYVGSLLDEFNIWLALPYFVGALASFGIFAGLSTVLDNVIAIRAKVVGDVKYRVLTADGYVTDEKSAE